MLYDVDRATALVRSDVIFGTGDDHYETFARAISFHTDRPIFSSSTRVTFQCALKNIDDARSNYNLVSSRGYNMQ